MKPPIDTPPPTLAKMLFMLSAFFLQTRMVLSATILSYSCVDENCSFCNVNTILSSVQCLKCEPGFNLTSTFTCFKPSCATNQYYDNVSATCVSCHKSCSSCISGSESSCTQCASKYYQIQTINSLSLVTCARCHDPNCTACDRFGQCMSCMSGYLIKAGTINSCVKCTIPYVGVCATLTSVFTCQNGFYKSDASDACVYTKDTEACDMGKYKDTNLQCQFCNSKCLHCTSSTNCYLCLSGYFATVTGTCSACSSNCLTCSSNTLCSVCASGYFVSGGICVLITASTVTTCNTGEYPDWTNNTCKRCSAGCYSCDQVTGDCLQCNDEAVMQVVSGACVRICASPTEYFSQSSIAASELASRNWLGQSILFTMTVTGTCLPSSATNCLSPAYSATHCALCSTGYSSYLAECRATCPSGYFATTDLVNSQSVCRKCPRGCLACTGLESCTSCESDFQLRSKVCWNEEIHSVTTATTDASYVNFDGLWMTSCPRTTVQIGIKCILMSSCKRGTFRADIREVTCDECAQSSDVISGYSSVPELTVPWFGKCYTACPAGNNRCNAPCKQPNLQSMYNAGSLFSCSATPSCGSTLYLNRFCESTSSACASNQYLDLFLLAAAYHSFVANSENLYCTACPTGCSQCILQAHEVLCTVCSAGYDEYQSYSLQNPTSYDVTNTSSVYTIKYICKPTTALCTQIQGFKPHSSKPNTCVMCLSVDNVSCFACPPNSYQNRVDDTCIPYCLSPQATYINGQENFCYNYPSLSVIEDYGTSKYTNPITSTILNVANLSMKIITTVTSQFNLEILSGYCSISVLSSISIPHPISAITGASITTTIQLPQTTAFLEFLAAEQFNINCGYSVRMDSRAVLSLNTIKSNISQISKPTGTFSTTPTSGNSQTIFTTTVKDWSINLIREVNESFVFLYDVFFIARNNKDFTVQESKFKLKEITKDLTPEYYPSDPTQLTSFVLKLSSNLQNSIFNEVTMLLRVTPTLPEFAHLIAEKKILLDYSFTKAGTPKNSQRILIARIFETPITSKQTMKDLADETLLSRGNLPFDQEEHEDLTHEKQASMLTKIGFTIPCDTSLNCGDVGTCKRLNYNWYSMCTCPNGITGEQCDWTDNELQVAQSLLAQYLQEFLNDIPQLDSLGQPTTSGLSSTQILTLLQVWTDTRDTFEASTFEKLTEIFATDSLSKVSESPRLLYIYDNMVDILRKIDLSSDSFAEQEQRITANIRSTMRSMVSSLDPTTSLTAVVDQSNFKGLVVHANAFLPASTSTIQVPLPNSMSLTLPKTLVQSGEYLEVLIQPLDIMKKPIVISEEQLIFILSNSLSVTVKEVVTGKEIDVAEILKTQPIAFSMSFVLPEGYTSGFKNLTCIYWDDSASAWAQNGVAFIGQNAASTSSSTAKPTVSCTTTHLTEFAIANLDYSSTIDPNNGGLEAVFSSEYRLSFLIFFISLGVLFLSMYAVAMLCYKTQNQRRKYLHSSDEKTERAKLEMVQCGGAAIASGAAAANSNCDAPATAAAAATHAAGVAAAADLDKSQLQNEIFLGGMFPGFFEEMNSNNNPNSNYKYRSSDDNPFNDEFNQSISIVSESHSVSAAERDNLHNDRMSPTRTKSQQILPITRNNINNNNGQQQNSHLHPQSSRAYQNPLGKGIFNNQNSQRQMNTHSLQQQKLNRPRIQSKDFELQNMSTHPLNQLIESSPPPQQFKNQQPNRSSSPLKKPASQQQMNYPKEFSSKPKNALIVSADMNSSSITGDENHRIRSSSSQSKNLMKSTKPHVSVFQSVIAAAASTSGKEPQTSATTKSKPAVQVIGGDNDVEIPNHEGRFGDLESVVKQSSRFRKNTTATTSGLVGSSSTSEAENICCGNKSSENNSALSSIWRRTQPYSTLFSWKYSFDKIRNTERVLFVVLTISLLMFCASYYFEYINLADSQELTFTNIILQSTILLVVYEVLIWLLVALAGLRKLFSRQIYYCCFSCCFSCCDKSAPAASFEESPDHNANNNQNSRRSRQLKKQGAAAAGGPSYNTEKSISQQQSPENKKKRKVGMLSLTRFGGGANTSVCCCSITTRCQQIFWESLNFLVVFLIYVLAAYLILELHKDQSKRRFLIWAIATSVCTIANFIIEFASLYLIFKFRLHCLLSLVKYKRLDF